MARRMSASLVAWRSQKLSERPWWLELLPAKTLEHPTFWSAMRRLSRQSDSRVFRRGPWPLWIDGHEYRRRQKKRH